MYLLNHEKAISAPWNKGKLVRQKTTIKTERNLGDPYSTTVGNPPPGFGNVQSGNR